ncbi:hypothetical protein CDD83_8246 [Cordyceps sp. RAO-2017]|nr:hypothetical protein CDD83_8246 [Cordyceps sp. RAO-2017]
MSQGQELIEFLRRFQELQGQRDTTDNLIRDILVHCDRVETNLRLSNQKLVEELRLCKLDLDDATNSRRELQLRLQTHETKTESLVRENEESKSRNPYVFVAIDSDAFIFRDRWTKQGVEGGRRAAQALQNAVAHHFHDKLGQTEIVVKVIVDLGRLFRSLRTDERPHSYADLRDFAAGFAQGQALFEFVDVGPGKDAARFKLQETARWHLRNQNCQHALLGITHTPGYLAFLNEMLGDDEVRPRLSIMQSTPMAEELVATGAQLADLGGGLFRVDKPPGRKSGAAASRRSSSDSGAEGPEASTTSANTASPSSMSYANAILTEKMAPPPPQVATPAPARSHMAATRSRTQYQQFSAQQLDWNPGPRGLDEPITVSLQAMETIRKRKDHDKLCNNHFLRGPCTRRDVCLFVHNYKPNEDEIKAIAVLARYNPCSSGQDCMQEDCIYGHNCPSMKDGVCCHPFCKFPESAHPPRTRYKSIPTRAS